LIICFFHGQPGVEGAVYRPEHRPGPEPEQPFSYERKFDLTQQKVIFNPIGKYATDVTFAHIELRVSFAPFLALFEEMDKDIQIVRNISQAFRQAGGKNPTNRNTLMADILDSGLAAVIFPAKVASERFTETLYKLPEVSKEDAAYEAHGRLRRQTLDYDFEQEQLREQEHRRSLRQRRFVEALVGVGASIIGVLWDVFKQRDISRVKDRLRTLEQTTNVQSDRIQMLMQTTVTQSKLLEGHSKYLKALDKQLLTELSIDPHGTLLKMRTFGSLIEDQVRLFGDTVKMAQLGKLNPDQFSYELIKEVAKFIWDLEDTHDLVSPIHKPADVFKMPLSYLYNLETEHLEFIVHVPLTRPQQVLDMYEFFPFPMTMTNDRTRVALPRPGAHNILAYNGLKEYQTMSSSDLVGCFVIDRVHYCANRQVLKTNWAHTCLSALFTMNQEAATRYCDFQIQPADERIVKLDQSRFMVYTNRVLVAEKYCGDATHESVNIQEGSIVQVGPGCRLKLDSHQIYGEQGINRAFDDPRVFSWTWDAKRVLRNFSGEHLDRAFAAMEHEAGMTSFETEDLLQQLDIQRLEQELEHAQTEQKLLVQNLNNPFSIFHWIGVGMSALVTFVAVTILAGCAIRSFRQLSQARYQPPSPNNPHLALEMPAPSAPVAIPSPEARPVGFVRGY
jgi:hypothetical protein